MRKLKHSEIPRVNAEKIDHLSRHPITVVLDGIRSIYNVGSIFRTSDAALVQEVVLTGISGTPANRSLRKTALGAEEVVPWSYQQSGEQAVELLKEQGHTICVLEITDSPTPLAALGPEHFPICLVLGNEVHGVQSEILALADYALEIPQYGIKQSLNVAVAYGITVMHLVERYRLLFEGHF